MRDDDWWRRLSKSAMCHKKQHYLQTTQAIHTLSNKELSPCYEANNDRDWVTVPVMN
jgi:hypothetical protein